MFNPWRRLRRTFWERSIKSKRWNQQFLFIDKKTCHCHVINWLSWFCLLFFRSAMTSTKLLKTWSTWDARYRMYICKKKICRTSTLRINQHYLVFVWKPRCTCAFKIVTSTWPEKKLVLICYYTLGPTKYVTDCKGLKKRLKKKIYIIVQGGSFMSTLIKPIHYDSDIYLPYLSSQQRLSVPHVSMCPCVVLYNLCTIKKHVSMCCTTCALSRELSGWAHRTGGREGGAQLIFKT